MVTALLRRKNSLARCSHNAPNQIRIGCWNALNEQGARWRRFPKRVYVPICLEMNLVGFFTWSQCNKPSKSFNYAMKSKMQFKIFHIKTMKAGKKPKKDNSRIETTEEQQHQQQQYDWKWGKKTSENTKYEMKSKSISVQMMDIYQRLNITQLVK